LPDTWIRLRNFFSSSVLLSTICGGSERKSVVFPSMRRLLRPGIVLNDAGSVFRLFSPTDISTRHFRRATSLGSIVSKFLESLRRVRFVRVKNSNGSSLSEFPQSWSSLSVLMPPTTVGSEPSLLLFEERHVRLDDSPSQDGRLLIKLESMQRALRLATSLIGWGSSVNWLSAREILVRLAWGVEQGLRFRVCCWSATFTLLVKCMLEVGSWG